MAVVLRKKTQEVENPVRTKVALAPTKLPTAPIAKPVLGIDLTDEEVHSEMKAATKRSSSFGYKLRDIREQLKTKDYQGASITTKEAILSTLVELIPLAEHTLRKSGGLRGTYQFNTLIGSVRELLVDLDGERDLDSTIQAIIDESVRPVFILMAQNMIQFQNGLKRSLRAELGERECSVVFPLLDSHVKELAMYMQQMSNEVQKRVDKKLSKK